MAHAASTHHGPRRAGGGDGFALHELLRDAADARFLDPASPRSAAPRLAALAGRVRRLPAGAAAALLASMHELAAASAHAATEAQAVQARAALGACGHLRWAAPRSSKAYKQQHVSLATTTGIPEGAKRWWHALRAQALLAEPDAGAPAAAPAPAPAPAPAHAPAPAPAPRARATGPSGAPRGALGARQVRTPVSAAREEHGWHALQHHALNTPAHCGATAHWR